MTWRGIARYPDRCGSFFTLLDRCVEDAVSRISPGRGVVISGRRDLAPAVVVAIEDERVFQRTLGLGNLGLGEAYMDGDFHLEQGTLAEFLAILLRNRLDHRLRAHPRLAFRVLALRLGNRIRGLQTNVRHHYDQGDDLFEAFLDRTMTYSCGYARTPEDSVEQLQQNKFERICRKLRLAPGQQLLDIGCGFGGLLIHAARTHGVRAVGITNSRVHWARGRVEVEREGLANQVDIRLGDFASLHGRFDRIVSVGMLEHVPRRLYRHYFRSIARYLAPGGLGLVHTIGCNAARNEHDPFTQAYIFPGSNQPRLSEMTKHLESQPAADPGRREHRAPLRFHGRPLAGAVSVPTRGSRFP